MSHKFFPHCDNKPSAHFRLYCLPYAGATAAYYKPWTKLFSEDFELCPIELPGHGVRFCDPLISNMSEIVAQLTDAILSQPAMPFALFGHSMGSAIAFATTQALERVGYSPEHIFCSGRAAPHRILQRSIHTLPDHKIIEEMKRLGGTPDEIIENQELMELVMPVVKNDYSLIENYDPNPSHKISVPITVLCGKDDPDASTEGLAAWRDLTSAETTINMFNGNHFYINKNQEAIIDVIQKTLLDRIRLNLNR